jgi:hypothetical protein
MYDQSKGGSDVADRLQTMGKFYDAKKQKQREENMIRKKEEEDFIIMQAKIR